MLVLKQGFGEQESPLPFHLDCHNRNGIRGSIRRASCVPELGAAEAEQEGEQQQLSALDVGGPDQ